jgi:hypothetical protein
MKKLRCPNVMCLLRTKHFWEWSFVLDCTKLGGASAVGFDAKVAAGLSAGTAVLSITATNIAEPCSIQAPLLISRCEPACHARVQQIARNSVDRWLEKAAISCRRFNHQRITKVRVSDLKADEIRAIVDGREQSPVWIFAAIEVTRRKDRVVRAQRKLRFDASCR